MSIICLNALVVFITNFLQDEVQDPYLRDLLPALSFQPHLSMFTTFCQGLFEQQHWIACSSLHTLLSCFHAFANVLPCTWTILPFSPLLNFHLSFKTSYVIFFRKLSPTPCVRCFSSHTTLGISPTLYSLLSVHSLAGNVCYVSPAPSRLWVSWSLGRCPCSYFYFNASHKVIISIK